MCQEEMTIGFTSQGTGVLFIDLDLKMYKCLFFLFSVDLFQSCFFPSFSVFRRKDVDPSLKEVSQVLNMLIRDI